MIEDIKNALETLKKGGIILYPTDTIWGLGCDATNEQAVQRIYTIKNRVDSKSMLVLLENPAMLERYVDEVPEIAWDLIEVATTPLTVIYPNAKNLAKSLVGADGSVGIRFTREVFTQELIRQFRRPVVSTSANLSGKPSPSVFAEITQEIFDAVDYVVKFRQDETTPGRPSSIIKLGVGGQIEILRK